MKSRVVIHAIWVIAVVAAFLVGMSCSGGGDDPGAGDVTKLKEPTDVIDEELMIALAQAKNFHHKAKVYMSDGNSAEAIASVRQILTLRFPAGAPEADDVRHDARALLAKLLADQGQLDEAMRVVEEGLASVTRESFFVANLHTVKGEIHHKRAQRFEDKTDPQAIAERRAAIDALERSIKINETLQKQLEKR